MSYCHLCPNDCGVNREIAVGKCGEKAEMRIAKYYLHPYEEPFISGKNGSGTVFFFGLRSEMRFLPEFRTFTLGTRKNNYARRPCRYF